MLGLGNSVASTSAPSGGWTLFYESDFTSSTDGWFSGAYTLSANDSISGRTGLLKFTDKNDNTADPTIYKNVTGFASAFSTSGKAKVYIEYYIPSNSSSLEGVSFVRISGYPVSSTLDAVYNEFKEDEFVQNISITVASSYITFYVSNLYAGDPLTPDNTGSFGFISKIKIYV